VHRRWTAFQEATLREAVAMYPAARADGHGDWAGILSDPAFADALAGQERPRPVRLLEQNQPVEDARSSAPQGTPPRFCPPADRSLCLSLL